MQAQDLKRFRWWGRQKSSGLRAALCRKGFHTAVELSSGGHLGSTQTDQSPDRRLYFIRSHGLPINPC